MIRSDHMRLAITVITRHLRQRGNAVTSGNLPDAFTLSQFSTNGISVRAAVEGHGPLVIMVHGWPELWYSWRHQIKPIAAAG